MPKTYAGNLVNLSIRDTIKPENIPAKFSPDQMMELR